MENYQLFIITLPGLEELCAQEIAQKCPNDSLKIQKGGIELTANLEWIERSHLLLKIPTRILMRISLFKVRDFPKLHQKFLKLNWHNFLTHPRPKFEISSTKSRLIHTGKIEEAIQDALNKYLEGQPLSLDWQKKNYPPQTLYVRLQDDNLTLSLDLSGDPLYKRGLQVIKGEAPIRETLASALLFEMAQNLKEDFDLIDPMCGSGTFLTEAENFHRPVRSRRFAFEFCPFYKGKTLKTLTESQPLPFKHFKGFDINEKLINEIKKENANLDLIVQDTLLNKITSHEKTIMICNPPYGERIKIEGKRGSFLKDAWEKFLTIDKPFRFGWIVPTDFDDLFNKQENYRIISKKHLKNGGISVTFWIWEKN